MSLKCVLGFHTWNGCKCLHCKKTRDEGHDWATDCENCSKCDKTRVNSHAWSGCKCSDCDKIRDEGHDWAKDFTTCSKCRKKLPIPTYDQKFAFNNVASQGNLEKMKALLKQNPRVIVDSGTPLCAAVSFNRKDAVEFLLVNGADVNSRDKDGQMPLHIAAEKGDMDMAALLLANGADVKATNRQGLLPVHKSANGAMRKFLEAAATAPAQPREKPVHSPSSKIEKEASQRISDLNFLKGDGVGVLYDDQNIIHGLWFVDESSARDKMKIGAVLALQEGYGRTTSFTDWLAATTGLCPLGPGGASVGGFFLMFPSAANFKP